MTDFLTNRNFRAVWNQQPKSPDGTRWIPENAWTEHLKTRMKSAVEVAPFQPHHTIPDRMAGMGVTGRSEYPKWMNNYPVGSKVYAWPQQIYALDHIRKQFKALVGFGSPFDTVVFSRVQFSFGERKVYYGVSPIPGTTKRFGDGWFVADATHLDSLRSSKENRND